MRTPIRFKAETKYTESAEKKANTNLPIMARVGDGGGAIAAVIGRPGWYHIRLVNDANRLTQCKAEGAGLVYDDWIYVVRARDRKLTYYKFHSFIQSTGGLPSPLLYARGIIIPDNVAQGFYIEDDDSVGAGSPEYLRIVTTDGAQAVEFNFANDDVDFIVNANALANAFILDGATGGATFNAVGTFNAGITMGGASGTNELTIPGNQAIAMEILDTNAIEYLRIDTAPQLVIDFNQGQVDIDFVVRWAGGRAFDMRGDLGHIAMGTLAQSGIHCYIWDSTVDTTASYTGLSVFHGKTAGATDHNDVMYGIRNYFAFNQAAGEISHFFGFENQTILTDGNVGDAVNSRNAYGIYDVLTLTAGRIYGDAYGANIRIDQEAGNTIDDDAFVGYFWGDFDGTVTGTTYMCYLDEQSGVDYGFYQNGTADNYFGGDTGIGTTTPDRLFHAEESDAVTNAITYAQRLSHVSTNTPVALFGVGLEMELEDGGDVMQVASELVTLWADPTAGAESPLFRGTTYPIAVAGPSYWGFWTWNDLDNNARTVVPNGAGDVTSGVAVMFWLSESGGGTNGGNVTVANGANVDLYNDGVDVFNLAVAAAGTVTVSRTLGAATADLGLLMVWV